MTTRLFLKLTNILQNKKSIQENSDFSQRWILTFVSVLEVEKDFNPT